MLLGAHESVSGGLDLAFERARTDGSSALQVFTKNSNQWREPALTKEQILAFRTAHATADMMPVLAHTSYLINLAADDAEILRRSKEALVAELLRSSELGVDYCVLHPGAHVGAGDEAAVERIAEGLDEVHERVRGASARILLENTAGQGSTIGHAFEQLAAIFAKTREVSGRMGVCFDTQHAFAAGYDLATPEGYAATFDAFDRTVGLARLRAFHLNDSMKPLGARVDRHEHVGKGLLGLWLFWRLANDARFRDLPAVLETEPEGKEAAHKKEVALLRSLVEAPEPPRKASGFRLELSPARSAPRKAPRRA
jgi:deoxyribonuclease IV